MDAATFYLRYLLAPTTLAASFATLVYLLTRLPTHAVDSLDLMRHAERELGSMYWSEQGFGQHRRDDGRAPRLRERHEPAGVPA